MMTGSRVMMVTFFTVWACDMVGSLLTYHNRETVEVLEIGFHLFNAHRDTRSNSVFGHCL